jgi:hypothetical protein
MHDFFCEEDEVSVDEVALPDNPEEVEELRADVVI